MSIPKTLTPDQCEHLLEELRGGQGTEKKKLRGLRNHSMAVIMLETGIRVGELCGLIISDLWFQGQPVQYLVVRGEIAKNKQERHIPISSKLCETIKDMRWSLWPNSRLGSNMFAFKASDPYTPLSTRTVERFILEAGLSAFNMEVTPHTLRHTFGSRMMRKTNARIVQALLGHSSLQSTQIYMHPNSEDLRKAIDS
ncbi:hypothetical protein LCGC14_0972570 [marine sediment metagenome]|uniref:Tyr recombinase domain-containing protein n=1 Tax=marine sediment metagenome TaxID=412755 RepID=A0A0F9NXE7_9ZZZZ